MTPKEKAQELYSKMLYQIEWNAQPSTVKGVAKQCALIAVQERIDEGSYWMGGGNAEWEKDRYNYWAEVKQEIEKL
jgi:hypothetical protein